jgi:hypothetical protein
MARSVPIEERSDEVCSKAESIGPKNAPVRYAVAIPSRSRKTVTTEAIRSVLTHPFASV